LNFGQLNKVLITKHFRFEILMQSSISNKKKRNSWNFDAAALPIEIGGENNVYSVELKFP